MTSMTLGGMRVERELHSAADAGVVGAGIDLRGRQRQRRLQHVGVDRRVLLDGRGAEAAGEGETDDDDELVHASAS